MTWSEQIEHFRKLVGSDTEESHVEYVESKRALHREKAWQAIDNIVADGSVQFFAHGPEHVRRVLGPIAAFVPNAVATYLREVEGDYDLSTTTLELFDSTNFFEVLGCDVRRDTLAALAPLLPRILTKRKDADLAWRHWEKGFVALAVRQLPVWRGIAGIPAAPLPFLPGEAFGPNIQAILAYLGAAIEHRSPLDAILPAWRTLLAIAPQLRSASQLRYSTLFWIARIVYHDIGGEPLGEVAERLYADVQALVAAGM